jgi:hypothetical protein
MIYYILLFLVQLSGLNIIILLLLFRVYAVLLNPFLAVRVYVSAYISKACAELEKWRIRDDAKQIMMLLSHVNSFGSLACSLCVLFVCLIYL